METIAAINERLEALIRETGAFLLQEAATFTADKVEEKGRADLVSYVDKTAEAKLSAGCQALLPDSEFIREEGGNVETGSPLRWIIDPLDGTTNFIHHIPAFTISLALQFEKETVLGFVFDPSRNELYRAEKGKGCTLNGEPTTVTATPSLSQALLCTGFPYSDIGTSADYLAVFRDFLRKSHGVRRFGSAALDLAWVAAGRLDGFYEIGLNPWDVAAGALLVSEAGGQVSDFSGGRDFLFGRQIAACNPLIQPEVLEVIQVYY